MSSDIVFPENNELEFIEIAGKLDIRKLCFLYDFDDSNEEKIKKKLDIIENKRINIEIGFLVNQKNLNKAAKVSRFLVTKSSDKDRLLIESEKVRVIYGFEESGKRDYLHQRASGLNHTLCEIARKNNVAIGFSYSSIINSSKEQATMIIGRMMQNIQLCHKYKVKTIIASFSQNPFELRAYHDLASIFRIMRMNDATIKNSFSYSL